MRKIIEFARSVPAAANWIGGLTLIAWVVKALWLDSIPEPLRGMAALGKVVEGVFAALISGYVFYILFALWPDFKARQFLSRFISGKVRGIVGDCMGVLHEIEHASHCSLPFETVEPEILIDSFTAVNAQILPRLLINLNTTATWNQFFEYRRDRSRSAISDIFQQGRFLEPELVSILTDINDCSFFGMVKGASGLHIAYTNLSAWEPAFEDYLATCRDLAKWHDNNRPSDVLPLLSS